MRALVAQHLLRFDQDATDHNLPLLVWTGIRELPFADLVACAHVSRVPQVTKLIARRIAEAADKQPEALNELLANAAQMPDGQAEIVAGVAEALKGWRKAPKPAAWDAFVATLPKSAVAAQDQARQLNVIFGDGQALDEIRKIALDDNALMDQRRAALLSLIEAKDKQLKQVCEKLIYVRGVNMEAIQGLTQFDQDGVAKRIIERYMQFYPHERPQAIMALVSRKRFAAELLQAVEAGKIPKADFGPSAARQVRAFNDAKLNELLSKVWGETRETSADKLRLVAELKARHTPESLAKADQGKGRAIFAGVCGQCHKLYGEGGAL
ncbi:MAG: hypothetical protein EBY07_14425, partial [Actinobacteria bacterium]|nr:hypothetical protein [Actinomycetota bacterium]